MTGITASLPIEPINHSDLSHGYSCVFFQTKTPIPLALPPRMNRTQAERRRTDRPLNGIIPARRFLYQPRGLARSVSLSKTTKILFLIKLYIID